MVVFSRVASRWLYGGFRRRYFLQRGLIHRLKMCRGFTSIERPPQFRLGSAAAGLLHGLSASSHSWRRRCIELCFHGLRRGCTHFFFVSLFFVLTLLLRVPALWGSQKRRPLQAAAQVCKGVTFSQLVPPLSSPLSPAIPASPLCHSLTVADSPAEGAALHLC